MRKRRLIYILHPRRIMVPVSLYIIAFKTILRYAYKPFILGMMGMF